APFPVRFPPRRACPARRGPVIMFAAPPGANATPSHAFSRRRSVPRPAPAPRRSSLTPFYVILGLVLLTGIGLLVTKLRPKAGGEAVNQGVPVTLTPEQLQRVQGISIGRADAPITIY